MSVTHCTIQKSNSIMSAEDCFIAARQLTGAAFKLYIYFNYIADPIGQYTRAKVVEILNLSRHTLDAAFKELCEHHYLILNNNDAVYIFLTKVEETA